MRGGRVPGSVLLAALCSGWGTLVAAAAVAVALLVTGSWTVAGSALSASVLAVAVAVLLLPAGLAGVLWTWAALGRGEVVHQFAGEQDEHRRDR